MGEFFGSIYCWLEDFYGIELADYLWGGYALHQDSNMYIGIGLVMLALSGIIAVLYYYVVNHPRLNNWLGWLIFLGANTFFNFIVGWQWLLRDYYAGKMVVESKITGKIEDLPIDMSDILSFAATNALDSIIAFIFISYVIKWWSTNCSRAPF